MGAPGQSRCERRRGLQEAAGLVAHVEHLLPLCYYECAGPAVTTIASGAAFRYSCWSEPGRKMEFRVIWEIDIEAASPLQAVERARAVQLRPDMPATLFDVWEHARQKMHRVDLAAAVGRLEGAEMLSVRSNLRRLRCAPDLRPETKDLLSVMLIFLDAAEVSSRRY
jgi:hypothetical protein